MRWLAGWPTGRLAVGDKRTLLLRPVAQPRQSLYYIHRGWSAVNRDERGKRSDNCCFFFFEAPTTHAGSFSGVIVLGRGHGRSSLGHCREPQMRAASICPTRATALRLWVWSCSTSIPSTRVDLCPPLPYLPSPLPTPSLDHPRLCALVAIFWSLSAKPYGWFIASEKKRKWFRAPWYCELMVVR